MRAFQCIPIAFLFLPTAAPAQALPQSPAPAHAADSGWTRVRALSQGDKIAVTDLSGQAYRCRVSVPSEATLACVGHRGYASGQDYEFARDEILEVRRRHPGRDIAIAVGAVSTLGFIGGGRQSSTTFNAKDGATFAVVSGAITASIAIPIAERSPGNLIYRKLHSGWRPYR
jgi:hypothetical protein